MTFRGISTTLVFVSIVSVAFSVAVRAQSDYRDQGYPPYQRTQGTSPYGAPSGVEGYTRDGYPIYRGYPQYGPANLAPPAPAYQRYQGYQGYQRYQQYRRYQRDSREAYFARKERAAAATGDYDSAAQYKRERAEAREAALQARRERLEAQSTTRFTDSQGYRDSSYYSSLEYRRRERRRRRLLDAARN